MLEKYFKLKQHNTTPAVEIFAGLATFLAASYILIVNPLIQSESGMPREALFTATTLAIIIGTGLMAFMANMPFILAPGMGVNAFFAYAIVLGKGYTWQEALTMVFLAGILFVLSGVMGLRQALLRCFPEPLKHAMSVSLGLMIATIGLKNAGIIKITPNLILLGDVTHGPAALALIGLLITGAMIAMRMRGAMLLGIAVATVIGVFTGVTDYQHVAAGGAVSMPPSIGPIFMAFSFNLERILAPEFIILVFSLFAIDIFDSLGTFIGVFNHFTGEEKAKYESGIPKALMADAIATVAGSCLGASTVTTYVESSTGIAAGGRTGLTSVTIAVLAFLALFFSPVFLMVPAAAIAPALIIVGMYMMRMAGSIDFNDVSDGLPAIIMILITALTLSISDGLMFGWIGFMVFKLVSGKFKEVNVGVVLVGLFFLARLILL